MAKFKIKVTDKNHSKQFLMDSDANFDQIIQIARAKIDPTINKMANVLDGTIFSENLFFKNLLKKHTNNSCLYFIALKTDETLTKQELEAYIENEKFQVSHIFDILQSAQAVDICFLVDCTGSMEKYIDEVKTVIKHGLEKLRKVFGNIDLRFSFVGYRDYIFELPAGLIEFPPNQPKKRIDPEYMVLAFTNDYDTFYEFVDKIVAGGGGDTCEDVFGGLQQVLNKENLLWENNSRALIHVCDAPCHGKRYHKALDDDFPDGDPKGIEISKLIRDIVESNIDYYFCEIEDQKTKDIKTKVMTDEFQKEMDIARGKGMQLFTLRSSENLLDTFIASVTRTIMNTQTTRLNKIEEKEMKPIKINQNVENFTEFDADLFTFKFNGNLKTFEEIAKKRDETIISKYISYDKQIKYFDHSQEKVKIMLCLEAFARGNLRFAYKAKMMNRNSEKYEMFVAKNSMYKNDDKDTFKYNQQTIATQLISKYLSDEFCKITPSLKSLDFIDIKLLRIPEMGFYSIEQFIDGSFSKWSNNYGNLNENDYASTLDAFSHWTFSATGGYLVVSDLQGFRSNSNNEYILTDPAISCKVKQFTETDYGEEGINQYFLKHKCNHICDALRLKEHDLQTGEKRQITDKMTQLKK